MVNTIQQDDIDNLNDTFKQAYLNMRIKWEENHFYFVPTGTIVEMTKDKIFHFKKEHAYDYFSNTWKLLDKSGEYKPFLKDWLMDSQRRTITDMVYKMPNDCLPHEASVFNGYEYQSLSDTVEVPRAVELFNDILSAVCDDDLSLKEYVLKTFAHLIQKPFEKPGTLIIFSSMKHGAGKDTLIIWMKRIIGQRYYAHYLSDDEFYDKYDTQKEGCLLSHLEEAGFGSRSNCERLKAATTAEDMSINPKGITAYTLPDYRRIILTTNVENPVRIEESDRRYVLIRSSGRLVGKREYWNEVYSGLKNHNWIYTIGKYLESIDISEWNPRDIPESEYKKQMAEFDIPIEKLYLEQWRGEEVLSRDLFANFAGWCRDEGHLNPYKSFCTFARKISAYKDIVKREKITSGTYKDLWGYTRINIPDVISHV